MPEPQEGISDMLTGRGATVVVNFEEPFTEAEVAALSEKYHNLRIVQSPRPFSDIVAEVEKIKRERKRDRAFNRIMNDMIEQMFPIMVDNDPTKIVLIFDKINGSFVAGRLCKYLGVVVEDFHRSTLS